MTNETFLMLSNENISMFSFWPLLEGSLPSARGCLEPEDLLLLAPSVVISSKDETDQEQSLYT